MKPNGVKKYTDYLTYGNFNVNWRTKSL